MSYSIAIERGDLNYKELETNYRRHYSEMQARLKADGFEFADYNPRLKQYFEAFSGGWLINYVARLDGKAVGHSNVYLTQDMHNSELIAKEDMVYVLPEHRNGLGRRLVKFVLADLEARNVKRLHISAVTDLRADKLWKRMGFNVSASQMIYTF